MPKCPPNPVPSHVRTTRSAAGATSDLLTPYLLLGTLTLGAGLGAGLGLSQGPITHDAGAAASAVVTITEGPCTESTGRDEISVSCASSSGSAFSSS
jgi:hypothetical protein